MRPVKQPQQDAEKVRQRRSRIAQRLNVPKRTPRLFARCGLAERAFLSILLEQGLFWLRDRCGAALWS